MSQIEKLLAQFRRRPESVKYRDIEKILVYLNFEKVYTKGSHVKFKHRNLTADIIIPVHKNECKNFYKRQVQKQISTLKK